MHRNARMGQLKVALDNLDQLLVRAESATYAALLQACGNENAPEQGKRIHEHIIRTGSKQDVFLENHLVNMYGKCGNVRDAQDVFEKMRKRNVVSWTAIIAAFAEQGLSDEALQHFRSMQLQGVVPNKVTYVTVLKACAETPLALKSIHACIVESGLESDVVLSTALVIMYGRCGLLEDAKEVFAKVQQPDLILWNAVIAAYAGNPIEMLQLFRQMQMKGIEPDDVTFATIVNACSSPADLAEGRLIHSSIVRGGYESDLVVGNAIVDMYRKCGSLDDALGMFRRMQIKDVITWNSMNAAYAEHGCSEDVIQLFREMQLQGMVADKITFSSVLNGCATLMDLAEGKRVNDCIIELGIESDVTVGTALVNMYGKCRSLEDACSTFDGMQQKAVATWTVMVAAYAENGDYSGALQLFQEMQLQGIKPNRVTFLEILNNCANLTSLMLIHSYAAAAGLESDVAVCNTIIKAYGKCRSVQDAVLMFNKIPRKDLISWNALLTANVENEQGKDALQLFHHMQLEGLVLDKFTFVTSLNACSSPADGRVGKLIHSHIVESGLESNPIIQNALVSMYVKCGNLEDAYTIFNNVQQRNVITWTSMIAAFAGLGDCREALLLFQQMQAEGVMPNKITAATILTLCARLADMGSAKMVQMCVEEVGMELELVVANALLNLYGKCGSLNKACSLFDRMLSRDAVSWNAVIASHAQRGDARESILFFQRMKQEGMKPDGVTFVNILSACSHAGLVDEGCEQFGCLRGEYGITPMAEHYGCVVDLLGRAGRLAEAHDFINKMGNQPSASVWMSLLGACRVHGNVREGTRAAEKLLELDPQNAAAYVILSQLDKLTVQQG